MSVPTEADFYNEEYLDSESLALLPLADSPWYPLYEAAAEWVAANEPVVDLGCGTGRFLAMLSDGVRYGTYLGLDFSEAAVVEARRYAKTLPPGTKARYQVCDIRGWTLDPGRSGSLVVTCLETLEHLADPEDLELVRRLPPGQRLVASVPNYPSAAHHRWFEAAGAVWERYSPLLSITRWRLVELGGGKAIHLIYGTRRADTWE